MKRLTIAVLLAGLTATAVLAQDSFGVNGLIQTILASTVTATSQFLAPTGCTTVPYSFTGDTDTGICEAADNDMQFYANGSPRLRVVGGEVILGQTVPLEWGSSGIGSIDVRLRRTATKTVTFDDGAGGAATFAVIGDSTASNYLVAKGGRVYPNDSTRGYVGAPTDGLFQFAANGGSFRVEVNSGATAAPTVTSCGTGTIASTSRNSAGTVTATGATACTVTFATPAFTNAPHCTVTLDNAVTTTPYVSARSTSAITVSGLTAGDVFSYTCFGGA